MLLLSLPSPAAALATAQAIAASGAERRIVIEASTLALNTFLLRGFFEGIPWALEEAMIIDGAEITRIRPSKTSGYCHALS